MSAFIRIQANYPHGEIRYEDWSVDKFTPDIEDGETVLDLEASGDELNAIIATFANLCYPHNKGVAIWRGEMARFILDNV